jgi:RNA polymerase sigma-70 factor, ECF subfamily
MASNAQRPMATNADIAGELEQHRNYLMRIARLQLRDDAAAEDVVQETLLAALAAKSFSGQSALRTWLTSILKHKIVDVIRKRQRQSEVHESHAESEFDPGREEFDSPFDENGSWEAKPANWGDPEQALSQRQFLDVMAICMENLPANTARVFVMREYMELEVAEISRELAIAAAHVYVILYRARAGLRQCLEKKWFGIEPLRRKVRKSS